MITLLSQLRELRLDGIRFCIERMSDSADPALTQSLPLLRRLLEAELENRRAKKTERLSKNARFRYMAGIQSVLTGSERNLDRALLEELSDGRWIKKGQNLLITGPTGAGKSWISSAIGRQACLLGHSTLYFNCSKLWRSMSTARKTDTYAKELKKISKTELIILDDFGLVKMDANDRLVFLEILEERWGRSSTMVVSQRPFASWHEAIGEPTIADAVCDRLFSNAQKIELKGASLRSKFQNA